MSEELFGTGEEPGPTQHQKILVAHGNNTWDSGDLARHLRELEALTREGEASQIVAKVQQIVPEYRQLGQP